MLFKNVFKSISRSKGRTLLILTIVTVIAVASTISLSIREASLDAQEAGKNLENITASIEIDRSAMFGENRDPESIRENLNNIKNLSLEQQIEYTKSDFVKDYYVSASTSLSASSFEAFSQSSTSTNGNDSPFGINRPQGGGMGGGIPNIQQGDITISAVDSDNGLIDFNDGTKTLVEGTLLNYDKADMYAVINQELAQFNGLVLGDTISLTNPSNEDDVYSLEIVGIYESASSTSSTPMFGAGSDPANQIYINYKSLEAIASKSAENPVTETNDFGMTMSSEINTNPTVTYIIDSVANFELFENELRENGLDETYSLTSLDLQTYESRIQPYESLVKFATTLFWVVLAVGSLVLIVIHTFNIRERKFEVGVYTAIGLEKWKVATQFVLEIVVVSLMGTIIGTGLGSVVSLPVANVLVSNQLSTQSNDFESIDRPHSGGMPNFMTPPSGFEFGDMFKDPSSMIETIDATVNTKVLIQLIGVGLAISMVSSLVAVSFVLRYEPLEILSERA